MCDRVAAEARRRGPLLLDGPTGTELVRRGGPVHPVLWTAEAARRRPDLLAAVHRDYVTAGAEVLTANTFRTTAWAAAQAGHPHPEQEARALLQASVALARGAGAPFVAGSLAPLGDCYRPQDTPPEAVLDREHARTAAWLVAAGCNLVLCETMGTAREARAAVRAARAAGAEAWVSFLPADDGAHLLGGDDLLAAARTALACGAAAVLVNCAHATVLERALDVLAPLAAEGVVLGAYPNAARMHQTPTGPVWEPDDRSEAEQAAAFAAFAQRWAARGVRLLGACCGATPA